MATRPEEPLVTDRTYQDILQKNTKANYNADVLNRIESWMLYLKELLAEYGYYANIETKIDWEIGLGKDKMTSEINRIKNNLQILKDTFYVRSTTPEVPSTTRDAINYVEANNIEKIIVDLDFLINNMADSFIYCDTIYCGE